MSGQTQRKNQSIAAILDESLGVVKQEADSLGVRVSVQQAAEVSTVYADRRQVEQAILYLARTAMASIPRGPDRELTMAIGRLPDGMVEFSISDTSPRVPEELGGRPDVLPAGHFSVGFSLLRSVVSANGGEVAEAPSAHGGVFRFTLLPASMEQSP